MTTAQDELRRDIYARAAKKKYSIQGPDNRTNELNQVAVNELRKRERDASRACTSCGRKLRRRI